MSERPTPMDQQEAAHTSLEELRQHMPLDAIEQNLPQDAAVRMAFDQLRHEVGLDRQHVEYTVAGDALQVVSTVEHNHTAATTIATARALENAGHVVAAKPSQMEEYRLRRNKSLQGTVGAGVTEAAARYQPAELAGSTDSRAQRVIEGTGYGKKHAVQEMATEVAERTAPDKEALQYFQTPEGQDELTRAGLEGFDKDITTQVQGILDHATEQGRNANDVAADLRKLTLDMQQGKGSVLSDTVLATLEKKGVLVPPEKQQEVMDEVIAGASERLADADKRDKQARAAAKIIIGFTEGGGDILDAINTVLPKPTNQRPYNVADHELKNQEAYQAYKKQQREARESARGRGGAGRKSDRSDNTGTDSGEQDSTSGEQQVDPTIVTEGPLTGQRLDERDMAAYNDILHDNPQLREGKGTRGEYRKLAYEYHPDQGAGGDKFGVLSRLKESGAFEAKSGAQPSTGTAESEPTGQKETPKPQPAPAPAPRADNGSAANPPELKQAA